MVFTARIRRLVVMPIDEPVSGCSPTKYRLSNEQIDTLELDDVASDYSRATQGLSSSCRNAEYLVLKSSYKTCAALNQTCHAVRQKTTPTLWRTLSVWNPPRYAYTDSAEDEMQMREINERWENLMFAPGREYTDRLNLQTNLVRRQLLLSTLHTPNWVFLAETLTREAGKKAIERNDYICFVPDQDDAFDSIYDLVEAIGSEDQVQGASGDDESAVERFKYSKAHVRASIVDLKAEQRTLTRRIEHLETQSGVFRKLESVFDEKTNKKCTGWRDTLQSLEEQDGTISFDDFVNPVEKYSRQQSKKCTRQLGELKGKKEKLKQTRSAIKAIFL
ncbi:hypothetical protein NCC49_002075 [Naganishia albida]|nr:hypothetical protein NCC49_002075 [Naganishia albida]